MQPLKKIAARKKAPAAIKLAALRLWVLIFFLFSVSCTSFGQLAVTQNSDATILSQLLAGSGVTISNITKNCNTVASGTFNNTSSDLGLTQGVVLSTGKVSGIPQPASSFASTALTGAGDPQLSTLTAGPIYDPCILEFDVVPQGDTLQFKYVFASEEYPEFVCSQFNDVFGFFITGPNPSGGSFTNKNLAIIPNSTLPVCINAVNDGISGTYNGTTWNSNNCVSLSYTGDYVNNISPITNPYIVYNGMTVVLSAVSAVVPCQSYHLKIAIADVGDRYYDSGVFLQAYSVSSKPYTLNVSSVVNDTTYPALYKGCMGGTFTVSISSAQTSPVTVALNISGTATNGVDYSAIPDSITIPAGQTSVIIPVSALQNNFPAGGKNVVVSILNQCSGSPITSDSLLLMNNPVRDLTVSDTTLCAGQSSQLTATGGKSYVWTPIAGLSSSSISNPIATPSITTNYTANITWGTCVYQLSQTIHVSNPAVLLAVSLADTVCTGTAIQLSATANGGVAPYAFLWSNGSTTGNVSSITGGTFSVTATDGYGCKASSSKNIVELNPALSMAVTNVNCYGANTGTISATAAGGIGPYSYIWSNGTTNAGLINIAAGSYNVKATDAKGCTVTNTALVNQPLSALVPVATTTGNVSCFNGNNGAISLTVTGGTAPYIYDWASGVTTQNRTNLTGGTYDVTITDSKGCSATTAAAVTEPNQILSANTTTANINCFGAYTGTISLSVAGGTSPYTFNWGGGVTTQNRSNLPEGNYIVTVTDANGCTTTNSTTISQPAAVLSSTLTPVEVSCFGGQNGSINTNVTGGTAPYYFNWSNGASIPDIANLAAGNYVVTITDANGCSITNSEVIVQPASSLSISASANNISCFGANNGSVTLTVAGGTPAYAYSWTVGVTTQNRTNLTAGSYDVTVTDSKECSATAAATITQPVAALSAVASSANINCYGANTGSVNLTVSGGTTPYTYRWTGGVTTQNRSNLTAGNYSVTVTDANGCTTTNSTTISQPAAVLSSTLTPVEVSCFGGQNGSINTNVTGGTAPYYFNWSNGASIPDIANLAAGNYVVTITDANGCSITNSEVIVQPASSLSISASANNISCFGANNGSVTLTVAGGTPAYAYSWTVGVTTQNRTNLTAGSYDVTVTDSKECSATAAATITQPVAALNVAATTTNINCYGGNTGNVNLTVSGGTTPYTYSWTGGVTTQNRNNLTAGNYSVTVTDANGCSTSVATTVTQPTAALNATVASLNPVLCFGGSSGSIHLNVSGGSSPYDFVWSNGATSQALLNAAAGNYTVSVTDSHACSVTASGVITQPAAALSASLSTSAVNCNGGSNGVITSSVSGGTAPYSFHWNDGSVVQNRNNLGAGNYQVVVTDANGCSIQESTVITQPASALNVTEGSNNVVCYGGNNGTIQVNVSGGSSPYSYNWSDGSTAQNRAGLQAGNYVVTVKDANTCIATISVAIAQPASALSVTPQSSAIKCFGGATGSISLNVEGGTLPYSYNWGGGVTSAARNNLTTGVYTASVTDANGCSTVLTDSIAQPASAVHVSVIQNNVGCYGDMNGSITTTTNGGVEPYNYTWSDGSNAANQTNLSPGNYLLTVTDANACTATTEGQISQPAQTLKALAAVINVTCNAENNGAISLNVTGGTPPYFFKWDGNNTSENRTQLTAGNYQVTVTDANGCNVVEQNTVTQPAPLVVALTATAVSCNNGNNGSINLSAIGGTPAYTYHWENGGLAQNLNQLTAGSYAVTLTDANLCTTTASANVSQPVTGVTVLPTVGNVSCLGGNNGTIQLSISGGNAPYTFNWNGGITTQNRTGLVAGNYVVSVSDGHGCNATASATVDQPVSAVNAAATSNNVSCFNGNNGAVNLTVGGGTAPYAFGWNSGQRFQDITNLVSGFYSVTVNDANGCSAEASAMVTQPTAGISSSIATHNINCYGENDGSLNLTVTGGTSPYSYAWSNGATTQIIQALTTGIYHVTITDAKGCNAIAVSSITQPQSAVAAAVAASGVNCFGGANGSLTVQASGGTAPYTFNWGNGVTSQNRTALTSGNYTVTVTDANLCNTTVQGIVTQPSSAITVALTTNNVSCNNGNNGSVNLNVSGGTAPYNYNWGAGITSQNRNGLSAGNYEVTVTDSKGCSAAGQETISQPQHAVSAIASVANEVSCYNGNNGSITLNVSGGTSPYTFDWNGGVATENRGNLPAGTYMVTVTDKNGCTGTAAAVITQPVSELSVADQVTNIACFGGANGAVNINVTGGTGPYTYNWGEGINTENRSSLAAGNYAVTISDSKGCEVSISATVAQATGAITLGDVASAVSCFGGDNGSIKLAISGGANPYSFDWNSGVTTQDRQTLAAGTYSVTVTDAHDCTATTSITIASPDSISLTVTETSPTCYGTDNGKVQVNATGGTPGYQFAWSTGAGSSKISNVGGGTYSVTVTDLNGCTAKLSSIVLSQPAQINLAVSVISGACAGENNGQLSAVTTGGNAPYQYQWSNGAVVSNVSHLNAGNYVVTVTDANFCTQVATAIISNFAGVAGNAVTNPLPCQNAKEEIDLSITSGTGPYTFKWSDGTTTENLSNVHPGSYAVTVQDANGCTFDTTLVVENLNNFSVTASGGGTITLGGNSELHATGTGSAQTVFNWTPGSSLSCITCANTLAQPAETTTYTVVGTDTNGCSASDTVSVIVIEDYTIFTPNAFTPNGDGNNDYFQIFGNLAGINYIDIKIFDRWGEKVFESEEPTFKWDGTYKGVLQAPQVFAYEMKIVFNDGHSDLLKKGSITLIR